MPTSTQHVRLLRVYPVCNCDPTAFCDLEFLLAFGGILCMVALHGCKVATRHTETNACIQCNMLLTVGLCVPCRLRPSWPAGPCQQRWLCGAQVAAVLRGERTWGSAVCLSGCYTWEMACITKDHHYADLYCMARVIAQDWPAALIHGSERRCGANHQTCVPWF